MNLSLKLEKNTLELLKEIGHLASTMKYKAYLVGGPVRDLMLGLSNLDLDIVIEGQGIRLAEKFAELKSIKDITSYQAFKTATVRLANGHLIDFATARKEVYVRGGAFPKVEASTLKNDLFRRDFTINAMAISINHKDFGFLVDPFKGCKDLKAKKLRVLHENSFGDDPTRILRAARFMARFGLVLEIKTAKSLKKSIQEGVLDTIKTQRYQKDLNKILKEKTSKKAIEYLKKWQAYRG